MTMGSDFQYENANMWFKNMDKLIRLVNEQVSVPLCVCQSAFYQYSQMPEISDKGKRAMQSGAPQYWER